MHFVSWIWICLTKCRLNGLSPLAKLFSATHAIPSHLAVECKKDTQHVYTNSRKLPIKIPTEKSLIRNRDAS